MIPNPYRLALENSDPADYWWNGEMIDQQPITLRHVTLRVSLDTLRRIMPHRFGPRPQADGHP